MKNSTCKRVLAAALSAAMAVGLAACGSTSSSATGSVVTGTDSGTSSTGKSDNSSNGLEADDLDDIIPDDTVTLTCYSQLSNYSGEMTGWFAQVLKDKFNVKINIVPKTDGAFSTRMESGNLGDIVILADSSQYQQAVDKGMLLDWNDDDLVEDYGPYIYNNMQTALKSNAKISGGTTYGIGYDVGTSATAPTSFMYDWSTRYDLYQKIGSPAVTDLDSFADMLIKMEQAEPTSSDGKKNYAVSLFSDWDGSLAMFPKAMVTAYYGYDEFGIGFYDSRTQSYIPAVAEDSPYVEALKFYNKLYQAGAMDPDSETQGWDGFSEDIKNGNCFFTPFNYMGDEMFNTDAHLAAGEAMYPVVPSKATTINYGQNIYGGNRIWCIGNDSEYPELCMAIINWLCTPEGKLTDLYGPENVCWTLDDNGIPSFTDLGKKCHSDSSTELTGDYSGKYSDGADQMNNTTWALDASILGTNDDSVTYNSTSWPSNEADSSYQITKDWENATGSKSIDEYMRSTNYTLSPGTNYAASSMSDELTVTANQVEDCIKTYSWKAMEASSDSEFNSIIKEMISKCKEYGIDDVNAYYEKEAKSRAQAENDLNAYLKKNGESTVSTIGSESAASTTAASTTSAASGS